MLEDRTRVRTGYDEEELRLYTSGGGKSTGPGWLTIVVGPVVLEEDLIDPVRVDALALGRLGVDGLWGGRDPLIGFNLKVGLEGFFAALPEPPTPPGYAVRIHQHGLLEFGMALDWTEGDSSGPYLIATSGIAVYIHDVVLKFLQILRHVGYTGEVAVMAGFFGVQGHELGIESGRYFPTQRPIDVSQILSRPLVGLIEEIENEAGQWVRGRWSASSWPGGSNTACTSLMRKGTTSAATE